MRVLPAFSRAGDGPVKYVQDRLWQERADVMRLLDALIETKCGADKAKAELATANKAADEQRAIARNETTKLLADAEKRAAAIVDEAKKRAEDEGAKIVAAAKADAEQQATRAREALREQVAVLAVKGAEQILQREVNASVHAELLGRLKAEL